METNGTDDRRDKIRVEFKTDIKVQTGNLEFQVAGNSKDLSLSGVFVNTDQSIPLDTDCRVEIILTGMTEPLTLKVEGRVVRSIAAGMAISFKSMDLESYTHLKNIVKYNVDDPDEVY